MTGPIQCSKHVGERCPREAVELLLLRQPSGDAWEVHPRCDKHPVADDIELLRRVSFGITYAIVPLPAGFRAGVL